MKSADLNMRSEVSAVPELSLRDLRQRWWLMALLVTGMITCYMHRGTLSIAAPSMMKELQLSRGIMGVLLSAFFWSYSLMQVPAGLLVDRFGVRRSYALGYGLWSIATALTGFATNLIGLIVVRMLLGIGQAVAFPASARAVANWFQDRERGIVSAGYLTGVRVGQALIGAIGFFLLSEYGLRFFFLAVGIIPMLWLFPWLRFLRKWEKTRVKTGTTTSVTTTSTGGSLIQSLALLKHRSVFGIFLGFFAYDYAWFIYVTWLPAYLVQERNFSNREMGIYSSVPYIAMSVIIVLSGFLSDWLVRRGYPEIRVRKLFVVIGLAVGCLIVPAGMVEDKMTAVWLIIISLCGLGISSPNTWTLTQAVCSKNIVGRVSGIQNFGGNVGGILAPVLTGYIAQITRSFALALGLSGVFLVVGILAYWFLISSRVDIEETSPEAN